MLRWRLFKSQSRTTKSSWRSIDRMATPEVLEEQRQLQSINALIDCSWRCSSRTSGVAIRSIDLQEDLVVLDCDLKSLHRSIGGKRLRPAARQIEERAVPRALDRAGASVELALGEGAVVVRAAVLDRIERAVAVEDADLAPV